VLFHFAPLQCWGIKTKNKNIKIKTEDINFEGARNKKTPHGKLVLSGVGRM
jgi:hypothetical protein